MIRITVASDDGEEFLGIGLVWLLKRIDRFHSIREAAEDMDLSYVKALKILNRLEDHLGEAVIMRSRGGADRGGASLTPLGERIIKAYKAYAEKVKDLAKSEFHVLDKQLFSKE